MSNRTDRIGGARSSTAIKAPCRVASTSNITLSGFQTIDDVTPVSTDTNLRILVTGQINAVENGIYDMATGVWVRSRDFDGNGDFVRGTRVLVHSGTSNAGTWEVQTADPIIVGTTAISITNSAGTVGGTTGGTDNLVLRANGTGGSTIQSSNVVIDDTGNMSPVTTDIASLGTTTLNWADLFLDLGAVINFDSGDVTITHAANSLAFAGATSGYSFSAVVFPATNDAGALGSATLSWSDLFLASGGVINWNNGGVTITEASDALAFAGASLGYTFSAGVLPSADDVGALGSASASWSDLFLASGAVVNFSNGDVTVTHSANALTFAGASSGYSFDALLFPATNDVGALGTALLSWSDLFLATGGVINFNNGDVTITHAANALTLAGASSGYSFDALVFPATNDAGALGTASLSWSDLFLASGGVINWNNGDVTVTHSANLLAFAGATSGYTFDVPIGLASGGTGVSLADPNADRILFWDDSAGSMAFLGLAAELEITTTTLGLATSLTAVTAFSSGDKFPVLEGGVWKFADYADLPGAGAGIGNVVEDTTPQLGGNLDTNTFNIDFTDGTALRTGTTAANTFLLQARDVDGAAYTTFMTLTANNTPTATISNVTSSTTFSPTASDGGALGTTGLQWSDLFLASGAVVNFNNGDVTITHSANLLAFAGATGGYTFDVPINLASGGTGVSLSDPNADRLLFWDDSAGAMAFLTASTGLTITTTNITVNSASTTAPGISEFSTTAEYLANTSGYTMTNDQVWAAGALTALVDAATVAVDMSLGVNFSVTLAGNRTLGNPTNTKVGQSGAFVVTQDATGSRTLAYDTSYEFAGAAAPVLTTTANAKDILFYWVQSSTSIIITGILKAVA